MAIFETPDLGNILACWLPILYAGVLSCGIGYTLQVVAQADADPTAASLILSLESAFAAISGALVLHESMTLRQLLRLRGHLLRGDSFQLTGKTGEAAERTEIGRAAEA